MKKNIPIFCCLAGGAALASCQYLILGYAPEVEGMGVSQKIFYTHLPLAWWGLMSFFLCFVASCAYLITRRDSWDALARAGAEVGLVLAVLALVTGSIWARRAWGVWWTWDSRLTTTLVLCFLYAGYGILQGLDLERNRRATLRAVMGVIAFLDVPLVFFATRLWRSAHPVGVMSERDGLEPEMRLTVLACLAAFGLFWLGLVLLRRRFLVAEDSLDRAVEAATRHARSSL